MVYNKCLKKLAKSVYKDHVNDLIGGWVEYKKVVTRTLPLLSTKVQNWITHLLIQQSRKKITSTFDMYAAKILNRKSMFRKLAKIPTQVCNDIAEEVK